MVLNIIYIFIGLMLSLPAFSQSEDVNVRPKNRDFVICKNNNFARNIQVEQINSTEFVCQTLYTKGGKTKIIGSGKFADSCYGFLNNISSNLEKAGWKCEDLSGVKVIN